MLKRIFVALIGIPLLLTVLFWPGGEPFAVVCAAIGLIGTLELSAAMEESGRRVGAAWPVLGMGLWMGAQICPALDRYRLPAFASFFLVMLAWETLSGEPRPAERISTTLFLIAYPGLMAVPLLLRRQDGMARLNGLPPMETGALWVAVAFLFVWTTDTGAYFVGKAFGRRKLAPHLSPSKTWEGSVGGFLLAALLGAILGRWGAGTLFGGGALSGLALGALAGVWGQIGDLAESAMKREIGVKDLGGWLPGHGGALDRFDSFLFVCPLVYLWASLVR